MSSGGGVAITFSGDSKGAEQAIINLQKQVQRLTEDLKKSQQQSKQGADEEAKRAKFMENLKRNSVRLELQMEKEAASESKRVADEKQRWLANLKAKSAKLELQMEKDALREKDKALRAAEKATLEAERQGGFLSDQVGQIKGMVLGWIGVQGAVQVVNQLMQDQIALQKEISNLQSSTAQPQGAFLRNLGVVSDSERQAAVKQVKAISNATGVSESAVYNAGAIALSSKGNLSISQALDAVRLAAQVAPDAPDEMQFTAGALLDLGKVTGKSPEDNLGFLLQAGEQARVNKLADISQNLVPAAIGAKGFGGTAAEAMALATTMTQAMVDDTGMRSGTATGSLSEQLESFLPEKDKYGYKNGKWTVINKGTGLKSGMERIRRLQNDPLLRDKFLAQSSFEQKAVIPVRQILEKDSAAARMLEQNIGEYEGVGAKEAMRFIEGIQSEPLQQQAAVKREGLNISEQAMLNDPYGASAGSAYDVMERYRAAKKTAFPYRWKSTADMWLRENVFGEHPAETAMSQIKLSQPGSSQDQIAIDAQILETLQKILDVSRGGKNIDRHVE